MQNVTPRHRDRNPIALAFCKARLQSWSLTVWSSGKAWKLLLVWTNPLLTLIPLLGPAFKPNGCLHRKFASLSCRVSCRPAGMVALALDPPATITWAELPTGYLQCENAMGLSCDCPASWHIGCLSASTATRSTLSLGWLCLRGLLHQAAADPACPPTMACNYCKAADRTSTELWHQILKLHEWQSTVNAFGVTN